jgi:hypothetical protein
MSSRNWLLVVAIFAFTAALVTTIALPAYASYPDCCLIHRCISPCSGQNEMGHNVMLPDSSVVCMRTGEHPCDEGYCACP